MNPEDGLSETQNQETPGNGLGLAAHDLTCRRGERLVFSHLNLTVEAGEVVEIAGRNGCGKTSLLRTLCGLLPPEAGEVRWCGHPIREVRLQFQRELAYVGHADGIKVDLSAWENLQVARALHSSSVEIEPALKHLGLGEFRDVPGRLLSAGQRRRLALARLLVNKTRLWLLDEPFTALDKTAVRTVVSLFESQSAAGGMVVYTSHHPVRIAQARRMELS